MASTPTAADASTEQLPDLVADAPEPSGVSTYVDGAGQRLLLRFNGYIRNAGAGHLELRGDSPFGPLSDRLMGAVVQRIYADDGSVEDRPSAAVLRYETNDDHDHWHLMEAARYSLWSYDRDHEVGPAMKVGFCLADSEKVDPSAGPQRYSPFADFCSFHDPDHPDVTGPNATSVTMGISSGWRDAYLAHLAFQWVDVSDVVPGHYWLHAEMNPGAAAIEDDTGSLSDTTFALEPATVPGYISKPVAMGHVPANTTTTVALAADSFGKASTIDRRFKIVDHPDHGTLTLGNEPIGEAVFSATNVKYTPDPGYFGHDSFNYIAVAATTPLFPRNPPAAAVTMEVGTGGGTHVEISGAPESLVAGSTIQLSALVTAGPSPHITWKVNGVPGGTNEAGTITPTGLYTAPPTPPPGETVQIQAHADDGIGDDVTIRILPAPQPRPAPGIPMSTVAQQPVIGVQPLPNPPQERSKRLRAIRRGRQVIIALTPPRSGKLRVSIRHRRKRVASRTARVTGHQPATVNIRLPRRYATRSLQVVATLLSANRPTTSWKTRIR